jgi:hypothetical protein
VDDYLVVFLVGADGHAFSWCDLEMDFDAENIGSDWPHTYYRKAS